MAAPERVVILGAGIIGAATAYYLALRGVPATLVERHQVAGAASGKAGGFLALDWCDGSPMEALARKSFALHRELADLIPDTDYRPLATLMVSAAAGEVLPGEPPEPLQWLDRCQVRGLLGSPETTAQVHPARLTRGLLAAAEARGASLLRGTVESLVLADDRVRGVRVDGRELPADAVLIAMGPWSSQLTEGLGLPPLGGLKGTSILLRPAEPVPPQALFAEYRSPLGNLSPEVFPRPDGEVYLCGVPEDALLPADPARVRPDQDSVALLCEFAGDLSTRLGDLEPVTVQSCYRPIYRDGLPRMGAVPGVAGLYLGTGHNCWGILNGPASGLALAELIAEGEARSVDLRPFAVRRNNGS